MKSEEKNKGKEMTNEEIKRETVIDTEVLNAEITTQADRELTIYDKFNKYLVNSKKLREEMITIYADRLEHQKEILNQKYTLDGDVIKKTLYSEYLTKIAVIEKEAVNKLTTFSLEREKQVNDNKKEAYNFFDEARKVVNKEYSNNEKRHKREMDHLDKQEENEVVMIEGNAMELGKKSQVLFQKTIQIFQDNDNKMLKSKFSSLLG